MPTTLQFRRGNNTQNNSFTGAAGEITFDTTNKTLRVHDASTAGGTRLATHAEVQAISAANALDSDIVKSIAEPIPKKIIFLTFLLLLSKERIIFLL